MSGCSGNLDFKEKSRINTYIAKVVSESQDLTKIGEDFGGKYLNEGLDGRQESGHWPIFEDRVMNVVERVGMLSSAFVESKSELANEYKRLMDDYMTFQTESLEAFREVYDIAYDKSLDREQKEKRIAKIILPLNRREERKKAELNIAMDEVYEELNEK